MSTLELFAPSAQESPLTDVVLLRGFAQHIHVHSALASVFGPAPLRNMVTRMGPMSVRMTNCGALGWTSDARGYRYAECDPQSGQPWPSMPAELRTLAEQGATVAGFGPFEPDSCLINEYAVGAQMGSHQDRDERDFRHPIVSVSFGMEARFFIKPANKGAKACEIVLRHGDVLVWGRSARLLHHGIKPLRPGLHADLGQFRYNLTFRRAGD